MATGTATATTTTATSTRTSINPNNNEVDGGKWVVRVSVGGGVGDEVLRC